MTTKEAIAWAGGLKQLAAMLGIYTQTIYLWGEDPPRGRQFELHVLSGGRLKIDEAFYSGPGLRPAARGYKSRTARRDGD